MTCIAEIEQLRDQVHQAKETYARGTPAGLVAPKTPLYTRTSLRCHVSSGLHSLVVEMEVPIDTITIQR